MHTCKNCDTQCQANFCPNCGQTVHIHRYSIFHIGEEVLHSFTHADKSALVLLRDIFIRPGKVATDLIDGKRKRYFSLFTFFVMVAALYTIAVSSSHYYEIMSRLTEGKGYASQSEAMQLMSHHSKLLAFSLIPLSAAACWLLFLKKGLNYAEHLVFNTIIYSGFLMFMTASTQFVRIKPTFVFIIDDVNQVFFLAYMTVGLKQLFGQHVLLALLKAIVIRILQIAAIWLLVIGGLWIYHQLSQR
jgi:hypothetical protein